MSPAAPPPSVEFISLSIVTCAAALLACVMPLLALEQPVRSSSLERATFEAVRVHLKNGAFAEATALLGPITDLPNADPAPLYLHALVHLQQGTVDDADALVARLRARGTEDASAYAGKLEPVLVSARANAALREEFAGAVRRFDAEAASTTLAKMDLAPPQRLAIRVYIDSYRGRLASALAALAKPELQALPSETREALRKDLVGANAQFRDVTDQLRWYADSNLASSTCLPADARERSVASSLVLAEYVRLTELGLELFPFNDRLIDLAFHGALLSAPYEDLRRLGDTILAAKGTLRIPFYSSSSRLWLVLNDTTQRISLEVDGTHPANVHGGEQLGRHELFDHPYRAVRGLEQRANNTVSTGALLNDSFALKLKPSGVAPHYAFMTLVHCLYGEETQKQITQNLGRFVQHLINRGGQAANAQLVNPKQVTRERLQLFSKIVGTGTVIAAGAAEGVPGNGIEGNDGRKPMSETLRETAEEGRSLMTRREGLLKMYDSLRRTQRESSRTWAETFGKRALARALQASSARVEELIELVRVQ